MTRPIVRPNADRTDWRYYHPTCERQVTPIRKP